MAMLVLSRNRPLHAIILGLVLCLFILPLTASANAPPPPPMVWIDFRDWTGSIDAVQVLDCESPNCQHPKVLVQFGQCAISGCATARLKHEDPNNLRVRLDCQGKTCLMSGKSYEAAWQPETQFQLRVRSSDRLRSSPVFSDSQSFDQAWSVFPDGEFLRVNVDSAQNRKGTPALYWGIGFLLTLSIEFLVLSLALRWMKQDREIWLRTYISFGLMHLVTYPLVWTLPIGLLPFQSRIGRFIGFGELLVMLLYLGFLYFFRWAKAWKLIVGSLLLLACLQFAVLVVSLGFTYGQWLPFTTGINFGVAIAGTELVITVFEAIVLHLLSRNKLSLRQTGIISILINGASLVTGVLIWRIGL